MKIQTLIEVRETQIRAAVLEDGVPVSFTILPTAGDETGPLYRARVKKVDPKINAAFLDLGKGMEAFLPFRQAKALTGKLSTNISSLIEEGQMILVKITSPATEVDKLPQATANPMLAGRYALTGHLKGKAMVARAIENEEARQGLKTLIEETHSGNSLIVRSAAEGVSPDLVKKEIETQTTLWTTLEKGEGKPGIVLRALNPLEQILRDYAPAGVDEILIDNKVATLKAQKLAEDKWPDLAGKISEIQDGPVMEAMGVEDHLDYVRAGLVPLPSGGSITLQETNAMAVIDVNSGTGKRGTNPASLRLQTNLEAAEGIVREVRFQNLFGLITVDFIDMKEQGDREKVEAVLDKGFQADKMAVERTNINRFGLLTLKRARRGQTLKTLLEMFED